MQKIHKYILPLMICLGMLALSVARAEGWGVKQLRKTNGLPNHTKLNINRVSTWIYNNGDSDLDPSANSGFTYPKGSGLTAVFESGLVWGAKVNGVTQVGGSTYNHGVQPGKILQPGTAENPDLPKNRIYRVRPDYKTASVAVESREEGLSESEIRTQYETDWNEWPAADGAPYDDINNNGQYDAATDIPGVPGASQTVWFVANDLDRNLVEKLYGSQPMGIEMQATFWAYSQAGPLSNMIFRRYMIINKSSTPFTDMYLSMWSDPDNGDASDDYAGCDTTLSLGFCYNSNPQDAVYRNQAPPATGFDFFQGPVVAGTETDSAIFRGQIIRGKKNLPMTAFFYFARGDQNVTDPTLGSYEGTVQMYNFLQGRVGKSGEFFKTPQGQPTTFVLPGDPVTGTGWLDGLQLPAGDRRIGLSSGPFTMAINDTQEIVVAQIAAQGSDRLQSVKILKNYDQKAQEAYNTFFRIPTGAPPPQVQVTELDREVILNWGDPANAQATESYTSRGFRFQGYNVYQLATQGGSLEDATLVATYDLPDTVGTIYGYVFDPRTGQPELTPIQFGTNNGIQRSIRITKDKLRGDLPLNNGTRYYFAVTSYAFNPDPNEVPNVLENPVTVITVTPHSPNPGTRFPGAPGDTLKTIVHTAGSSDAVVTPIVIDPAKLTGDTYKLTFKNVGDTLMTWTVVDSTKGDTVLANQTNLAGDNNYFIFDGIQLKVQGPPPGMKDYSIPAGARKWTWASADGSALGLEGFNAAIGNAPEHWFSGSTVTVDLLPDVLIKFATTDTSGKLTDPNDPNASYGYRYLRGAQSAPAKPEFAPFIINKTASYDYQDYKAGSVPFAAFNAVTNQRLSVGFLENNVANGRVDGKYWPPASDQAIDNYATTGPREWFFIFNTPYGTTPDPGLTVNLNTGPPTSMIWFGTPNRRGAPSTVFTSADQFLIISNKVITPADVFTITAPNVTSGNTQLAKEDVARVNVFPNPYYGVNPQEINKYQRFVTFNHLPQNATIRIFNVSGQLVRTITRQGAQSQFERWNLANEDGLPVGSGMYIAHIDMGELGQKILKLAVIQEQQVLDRF